MRARASVKKPGEAYETGAALLLATNRQLSSRTFVFRLEQPLPEEGFDHGQPCTSVPR